MNKQTRIDALRLLDLGFSRQLELSRSLIGSFPQGGAHRCDTIVTAFEGHYRKGCCAANYKWH